jgi:hypothetical protein
LDLILRSMRAKARMRLEGWRTARSSIVAVLRDAFAPLRLLRTRTAKKQAST